jgi:phage shock protein A
VEAEDIESHLRAASDAIMLLLGEIQQLEQHKRGVEPGHDRFAELASAVRESAESLAQLTREQEAWGKAAPLADTHVATIKESASPAPLPSILQRWRDVERQLAAADPGSAEAVALFEEFERVRQEYLAAFEARETRD